MIRVMWAVWSGLWAVTWVYVATLAAPHRVCSEQLVTGPGCLAWGSAGSWLVTALFVVASGLSAALGLLSFRR